VDKNNSINLNFKTMIPIVPKFGRATAADEFAHQFHQDRIHGRIKIGSDREEREIVDAVRKEFGNARMIDKHQLYEKVLRRFSINPSDLVTKDQAEKIGEEFQLGKNDLDRLKEMEGGHKEDIDE